MKNLLCDLNTTFECEYYCTCTASTSLQGETYFSAQNRIKKKDKKKDKTSLNSCYPRALRLFVFTSFACILRLILALANL
jgi:hypothetical protein